MSRGRSSRRSLRRVSTEDVAAVQERINQLAHGEDQVEEPDATTEPAARLDTRPVEDVRAPAVSRPSRPAPGNRHRSRERRVHLRRDEAGAPCACSNTTPCLAHAGITGRRRHVRPE